MKQKLSTIFLKFQVLAILLIVIDQVTKFIFRTYFEVGEYVPVIENFFYIKLIYNTGAAASIFEGQTWLLTIFSILACVAIEYYLIKHKPIPKQNNKAVYNQVEKIELGGTIFFNFFFKLLKKRLYNYEVVRVSQYWIEILPKGTNKLDQLKYLVSKYHIDQNDLYVFGDGENDIEMLQYANNSYAPENALIEAKNAAHFKCESCNNNGVIKVIQNIIQK